MVKKLAKIFLKTAVVIFAIILLALIVLRIIFPPKKIKQFAISEIEIAINRQVMIGKIWFNPFKGLTLNDVIIYQHSPRDTSTFDTTAFFSSDKIHLKYRFLSLLKREIEINNILIEQPEINLKQDQNQRWNFEDLIAPDTTVVQPTPPDTGAFEFSPPVSFRLKKFSFNNFTTNIYIDQIDTIYTIRSGGLSIHVNDLFLPRKSLDEFKKNARADLKLFSDQKPWEFILTTGSPAEIIEFSTELQLDIKIYISGFSDMRSEGKIALTNLLLKEGDSTSQQHKISLPKLASIFYTLTTDAENGTLSIDHLTGQIGEETIFEIQGNITDFLNQPFFDLEVVKSEINLQNLTSLLIPLLPDTILDKRKDISIDGSLSFKGTKAKGNPLSENITDALAIDFLFSLDDFYASYVDPEMKLNNLQIRSKITEIHNLNGAQKANISLDASLDSIFMSVDTLEMKYGGINLDLEAALNEELMPDSVTTSFTVDNFFDVPLSLSLYFKSLDGINKFLANGNLVVDQLPLGNLPESMLEGFVDLALNLKAESLDQIDLDLKIESDIIEAQTETEPLILYPMDILAKAVLSTDTLFQMIKLKKLEMGINNFASALAHGEFLLDPQQQITVFIDKLNIDHEKVMAILPDQLLEGYESLKVSGSTNLTSKISVVIPENQQPIINADGKVLLNASVKYPDEFFTLGLIQGYLNFESNGESADFNSQFILDSLVIEGIQDKPLRNMSLTIDGRFADWETIKLDSASMMIPDLMTQLFLTAGIDSLTSENIHVMGNGYLTFNTEGDTVSLLNMLKLSGILSQEIDFSMLNNITEITGQLIINNLNVNYEDLAQADSISGRIYFNEKFDIENEIIVKNPLNQSFVAGAGSYYYDLLRPYYQQDRNRFSYLRIGKIKATDYYATDINFDLFIQNERIEIPRFSLKAYDGNMSGLIYANLHEGKPDSIEWKIKANVSRLNSAKLIPTRKLKAKGSDLNMNLELSGTGVDPASRLDVEGYLYVTEIGPQFTDNVLRSLDPKRTDKSIQDTRKLLNWGYKPKLISFEIKHGNLYPTIHLVKGKFLTKLIPLNLSGGKIELARIPVKFFLTNMMVESR